MTRTLRHYTTSVGIALACALAVGLLLAPPSSAHQQRGTTTAIGGLNTPRSFHDHDHDHDHDRGRGHTIHGAFCLDDHLFCLSVGRDGQAPVEGYGVDGNGGVCAKPPGDPAVPSGPQYCVPSGTGLLTLRPGTYWLTVDDPLNSHNFAIRSCPDWRPWWGSRTHERGWSPCVPGMGFERELTPICNDDPANPDVFKCSAASPYPETAANDIVKTVKVHLEHGTYRLFCDAQMPVVHESAGMYVDIAVRREWHDR